MNAEPASPTNEDARLKSLDAVRSILFGDQQRSLEEQIAALTHRVTELTGVVAKNHDTLATHSRTTVETLAAQLAAARADLAREMQVTAQSQRELTEKNAATHTAAIQALTQQTVETDRSTSARVVNLSQASEQQKASLAQLAGTQQTQGRDLTQALSQHAEAARAEAQAMRVALQTVEHKAQQGFVTRAQFAQTLRLLADSIDKAPVVGTNAGLGTNTNANIPGRS